MAVDFIYLTAEIAFRAFKAGKLTREELVKTIEQCVNVASVQGGYADKLGLPFPDTKFDDSDVEKSE